MTRTFEYTNFLSDFQFPDNWFDNREYIDKIKRDYDISVVSILVNDSKD